MTRLRIRLALAIVTVAALCSACTAGGTAADSNTVMGQSGTTSTGAGATAEQLPASSAGAGADPADDASRTLSGAPTTSPSIATFSADGPPMTTSAAEAPATSTATPTGPLLPGGTHFVGSLSAAGWLTASDQLRLSFGREVDTAPDAIVALCGFLFGTPTQIARFASLSGDAELDPMSTYRSDSAASLIACVYDTAGTPVLALQVSDGPPTDPSAPGHPIAVTVGAVQAVASYAPDYDGGRMTPDLARAWLSAVAGRVVAGRVVAGQSPATRSGAG